MRMVSFNLKQPGKARVMRIFAMLAECMRNALQLPSQSASIERYVKRIRIDSAGD